MSFKELKIVLIIVTSWPQLILEVYRYIYRIGKISAADMAKFSISTIGII